MLLTNFFQSRSRSQSILKTLAAHVHATLPQGMHVALPYWGVDLRYFDIYLQTQINRCTFLYR